VNNSLFALALIMSDIPSTIATQLDALQQYRFYSLTAHRLEGENLSKETQDECCLIPRLYVQLLLVCYMYGTLVRRPLEQLRDVPIYLSQVLTFHHEVRDIFSNIPQRLLFARSIFYGG
jgi:hypothetical protein